jgi:proteasome component ECM29
LLPVLLHGLAEDAGKPTCATVFNLFLRLLPRLRLPPRGSKEDAELRTKLGLDGHVEDAEFVSAWFSKIILLTVTRPGHADATARTSPPGLTPEDYDFLTLNGKPEAWDPNSNEGLNLTETKITILSFLASGAFTDTERFTAALFAAADPNSRISTLGEDILKRTSVSLEDHALIKSLYDVYFMSRPAVQTRILTLLSKSAVATKFPQKILGLVQESMQIRSGETQAVKGLEALKLRNAMFNFMNWVARVGSTSDLEQVAPSLVSSLRGYIEEQGWPVPVDRSADQASLRALAYETLGSMAKTVPVIAREPDLTLVRWLFRSLTEERSSDSIFISVEEALASLLNAFAAPLDPVFEQGLRSLLLKYMVQREDETVVRSARFTAVRWANRCLEYSDVVGRWIDILALGGDFNERSDVIEEGNKGLVCTIVISISGNLC